MRSSVQLKRLVLVALAVVLGSGHLMAQVANFTFSPGTVKRGLPVHFTDASTGMATSWSWNFGDPVSGAANTSTERNPTHTFMGTGVLPVSLQINGVSSVTQPVEVAASTAGCVESPAVLCLNGGRFQVTANWTKSDGTTGSGTGVPLTDDSGYFWFFDPANIEMVVKVLNGCALTNAYWVFAAGLTNVQVIWNVTDTTTGAVFAQQNDQGVPFAPVQATTAFPTSCP
jgi:PKD repeat protein